VKRSSFIVVLAAITLLGAWWGMPTYKKAQADAYVNELCAKDGGTRVFEKVGLPASEFKNGGGCVYLAKKNASRGTPFTTKRQQRG
jgi:hypothetical protein